MKATDTGHRYWKQENVQYNSTRTSNANMLALIDIMAMCVIQLDPDNFEPHPWLLAGTEAEATKIYGGTGLSPKLLHIFAQVTHLCGLMQQDRDSLVLPLGAKRIEDKLFNFRQWTAPSSGPQDTHQSPEALLDACILDNDGLAMTDYDVTHLGGEAWVQAARLYLQFRFFK
jgi:hypothetical protein